MYYIFCIVWLIFLNNDNSIHSTRAYFEEMIFDKGDYSEHVLETIDQFNTEFKVLGPS